MTQIKLLNFESSVLTVQSVTTLTVYEGSCPEKYILDKIKKIIKLNPWLNGKLKKINNELLLEYDDEYVNGINKIYKCIENKYKLFDSLESNYSNIINEYKNLYVKPGIECINTDEKLFKVALVKLNENKYGLFISISHCIADGYTYYKIYGMFSMNNIEEKLVIERLLNYNNILNNNRTKWFSLIGFVIMKIFNIFNNIFVKKINKQFKLQIIDKKKINIIKKKYIDNNTMVSTNDVITSEFFNKSNSNLGLMNYNYRNVDTEKYKLYSGNYIDLIPFPKKKYEPTDIRRILNIYKMNTITNIETFKIKQKNFIHNILNDILNFNYIFDLSCISSWSTLYNEIQIENSKLTFHVPCMTELNTTSLFKKFCIVFHYNNDKIGILSNIMCFE